MEPIEFKESNTVFVENQDEYKSLPAYHNSEEGTVAICYKLSFRETIKLLFSRKLWVSILTFNKPLQPQLLSVDKEDVVKRNTSNDILLLDS